MAKKKLTKAETLGGRGCERTPSELAERAQARLVAEARQQQRNRRSRRGERLQGQRVCVSLGRPQAGRTSASR